MDRSAGGDQSNGSIGRGVFMNMIGNVVAGREISPPTPAPSPQPSQNVQYTPPSQLASQANSSTSSSSLHEQLQYAHARSPVPVRGFLTEVLDENYDEQPGWQPAYGLGVGSVSTKGGLAGANGDPFRQHQGYASGSSRLQANRTGKSNQGPFGSSSGMDGAIDTSQLPAVVEVKVDINSPEEQAKLVTLLEQQFSLLLPSSRQKLLTTLLTTSAVPPSTLSSLLPLITPRLKRDFLKTLPLELAYHVLSHVDDVRTLARAMGVSRFWRGLLEDERTWKRMCWKSGFGDQISNLNLDREVDSHNLVSPLVVDMRHLEFGEREREDFTPAGRERRDRRNTLLLLQQQQQRSGSSSRTPSLSLSATFDDGSDPLPSSSTSSATTASNILLSAPRPASWQNARTMDLGGFRSGDTVTPISNPANGTGTVSTSFITSSFTSTPMAAVASTGLGLGEGFTGLRGVNDRSSSRMASVNPDSFSEVSSVRQSHPATSENMNGKPVATTSIGSENPTASSSYLREPPSLSNLPLSPPKVTPSHPVASLQNVSPPSSPMPVDKSGLTTSPGKKTFSYKTHFKRAYLTESAWLRGPGRTLSTQMSAKDGVVTSMGFDGEWIVVGMATSKVHVFEGERGTYVRTLEGHDLGVWTLCLVSKGGGLRDEEDVKGCGPGTKQAWEYGEEDRKNGKSRAEFHSWTTEDGSERRDRPVGGGSTSAVTGTAHMEEDSSPSARFTSAYQRLSARPDSSFSSFNESDFTSFTSTMLPNSASFGSFSSQSPPNAPPPLSRSHHHQQPQRRRSFHSVPAPTGSPGLSSSFFDGAHKSARLGGMGLGAGGETGDSTQQSGVCGTARGWGQPGAVVVSGGCDRTVRVWDVETGVCKFVLAGHSSTIRCMRVLDGRPIAVSGSRDATLRVWDIEKGEMLHVLAGHQHSVRCMDIHGNKVVSGSYDASCRLWDVDTGECLFVYEGHNHQIYAVAFDGIRVVTGSLDSTVRIWSATTGEFLALLQGHTSLVGQLQLDPVSNLLVTGGSDGRVIVFSLSTYDAIHRLCAHDNSVTCLQFDDRFIVTGGNDGRIQLWDTKTGEFIRELAEPCEVVWRVTFRDDKCVILCKREGKTLMDVRTFRPTEAELM